LYFGARRLEQAQRLSDCISISGLVGRGDARPDQGKNRTWRPHSFIGFADAAGICRGDDPISKGGTTGRPVALNLHFTFHADAFAEFETSRRMLR
jgi:hypothetical protein